MHMCLYLSPEPLSWIKLWLPTEEAGIIFCPCRLPYFACPIYPRMSQVNHVQSVHISGSASQTNPTDTHLYLNNFPLFNTYMEREQISPVRGPADKKITNKPSEVSC